LILDPVRPTRATRGGGMDPLPPQEVLHAPSHAKVRRIAKLTFATMPVMRIGVVRIIVIPVVAVRLTH
jgi:hypothetical protein